MLKPNYQISWDRWYRFQYHLEQVSPLLGIGSSIPIAQVPTLQYLGQLPISLRAGSSIAKAKFPHFLGQVPPLLRTGSYTLLGTGSYTLLKTGSTIPIRHVPTLLDTVPPLLRPGA